MLLRELLGAGRDERCFERGDERFATGERSFFVERTLQRDDEAAVAAVTDPANLPTLRAEQGKSRLDCRLPAANNRV